MICLVYSPKIEFRFISRRGIASDGWPIDLGRGFAEGLPNSASMSGGRVPRCRDAAMLLMIDNYDSFTWNVVQYLGELGAEVRVFRNDEITLDRIAELRPRQIVISPGPCTPDEAGVSLALVERFAGEIPLLGICLGHQSIGQRFGGRIVRAGRVMHGKLSRIHHTGAGVFAGLANPFTATRYHSLVIEEASLPECLEVTAWTEHNGEREAIMAVRHREFDVEGVQFHPESIVSEHGHALLKNFLDRTQ